METLDKMDIDTSLMKPIPPVIPRVKKVRDEENIHHTRTTIKGSKSWTTPLRLDPIISKGDRSRIKKKLKQEIAEAEKAATAPKIIIE